MKLRKKKTDAEAPRARATDADTLERESSLYSILLKQEDDPKSRQIALLVAIVFHLALITVTFPSFSRPKLEDEAVQRLVVEQDAGQDRLLGVQVLGRNTSQAA